MAAGQFVSFPSLPSTYYEIKPFEEYGSYYSISFSMVTPCCFNVIIASRLKNA